MKGRGWLGNVLLAAFLVGLALVWWLGRYDTREILEPPRRLGPLLQVSTSGGERVFVLTRQVEFWQLVGRYASRPPRWVGLWIDLWAFDPTSGQFLWKRRLEELEPTSAEEQELLGAQDGMVWIRLSTQVAAVSAEDGSELATSSGGQNLTVKPPYWAPYGTSLFSRTELELGNQWLGLLTDVEGAKLEEDRGYPRGEATVPRRLWVADVEKFETSHGPHTRRVRYRVLEKSGEFIGGGLLGTRKEMGGEAEVIRLIEPESLLLLHGEDRKRLKLMRISTETGAARWESELPLTMLQSVLHGENWLAIFGYEELENGERVERLVVVELGEGKLSVGVNPDNVKSES